MMPYLFEYQQHYTNSKYDNRLNITMMLFIAMPQGIKTYGTCYCNHNPFKNNIFSNIHPQY